MFRPSQGPNGKTAESIKKAHEKTQAAIEAGEKIPLTAWERRKAELGHGLKVWTANNRGLDTQPPPEIVRKPISLLDKK